ncbi:hypothetical protein Tco_1312930 [Tanacetum coccineum]
MLLPKNNTILLIFSSKESNGTPWTEVRKWMTEEFCPRSVLQRLEQELYNLKLKGTDMMVITNRFHEFGLLCPRMVEPEQVKVEQYIRGLLKNIRGDVTSSKPADIDEAVRDRGGRGDNRRDYNCRQNQRRANAGAMTNVAPNDNEVYPKCKNKKHAGDCWKCGVSVNNRGAAYKLGAVDAQQDPKVVTGTFLLNNRNATSLFDSGTDKSFVSTNFSTLIDIEPVELDTCHEVELAKGKVVQNCPLGCDTKINDLNKLNDNLDRLYNDCYIKVQAYQNAVKTLESQRAWYQNNQLAYEEKIRVLQRDLENTFNKWKESSKNLAKLIDNSMSVKSKLGDDNDFSYQEHVRFVKEGGMNVVPPPITGIFMPSSNQPDIDESKMTYGKKSCESIPAEESLPKPAVIEPKRSENVVFVPAGSSSNVPADYVSAGHVLVPADRDRIC